MTQFALSDWTDWSSSIKVFMSHNKSSFGADKACQGNAKIMSEKQITRMNINFRRLSQTENKRTTAK